MEPLVMDHVALAVPSIKDVLPVFELLLGCDGSPVEHLPSQGVRVTFVGTLELLEPVDPAGTVARFLEKRGPSLHHVAYRVRDLAAALDLLRGRGYRLIDEAPKAGARGHQVAFLHPAGTSGMLVELVQCDSF